jgi:hypothetical protein
MYDQFKNFLNAIPALKSFAKTGIQFHGHSSWILMKIFVSNFQWIGE